MPLDRAHVTTASRVMLPAYPVFFTGVGLSLTLTPEDRLKATPAFDYADRLIDLDVLGGGFLALAAAFVVALLIRRRSLYQQMLSVAVVWMTAYAALMLVSALDGRASFSAWTWPGFIALACWASLRSLAVRER